MEIRTTKTKSTDTSPSGQVILGRQPGAGVGVEIKGRVLNVHLGIWLIDVEGGGQNAVMQRQRRLDEAGRARRCFGMADLGLDTAQGDVLGGGIVVAEHFRQTGEFFGVASGGAGAMRFHEADGSGVETCVFVGAIHGHSLTGGARGIDGFITAVARRTNSFDDSINPVAISFGIC